MLATLDRVIRFVFALRRNESMKACSLRLLAALLAAACGHATAQDKVVYGTASRPGIANASMFLAESMGFFRDEGINISTVQFEGTAILLPQIANKSITIGYPIP